MYASIGRLEAFGRDRALIGNGGQRRQGSADCRLEERLSGRDEADDHAADEPDADADAEPAQPLRIERADDQRQDHQRDDLKAQVDARRRCRPTSTRSLPARSDARAPLLPCTHQRRMPRSWRRRRRNAWLRPGFRSRTSGTSRYPPSPFPLHRPRPTQRASPPPAPGREDEAVDCDVSSRRKATQRTDFPETPAQRGLCPRASGEGTDPRLARNARPTRADSNRQSPCTPRWPERVGYGYSQLPSPPAHAQTPPPTSLGSLFGVGFLPHGLTESCIVDPLAVARSRRDRLVPCTQTRRSPRTPPAYCNSLALGIPALVPQDSPPSLRIATQASATPTHASQASARARFQRRGRAQRAGAAASVAGPHPAASADRRDATGHVARPSSLACSRPRAGRGWRSASTCPW